jgi:hypothetical protein
LCLVGLRECSAVGDKREGDGRGVQVSLGGSGSSCVNGGSLSVRGCGPNETKIRALTHTHTHSHTNKHRQETRLHTIIPVVQSMIM